MEKIQEIEQLSSGTLKIGEPHPAAHVAMSFVKEFLSNNVRETMLIMECFISSAMAGNRLSEICHETLHRVINGEAVSDRYLLGLAWTIRDMMNHELNVTPQKNHKPKKRKVKNVRNSK